MNYKLRIKHPSGAEFEAEGPADFILKEKEGFLGSIGAEPKTQPKHPAEPAQEPDWTALTTDQRGLRILKNKHQGLKAPEAALLLLAAETAVTGSRELGAIPLSKAIKASGYAPERLDRVLGKALREGLVRASGTKRTRVYEITEKGLESAWLQARKLQ